MAAVNTEDVARLRGVIIRLARQLNATATGVGLTPTQASVLSQIAFHGQLGLAELVELEGLNPTMVSRVVRKLDEDGLIRRLPNPTDLRAARVEITPDGASVNERVRALRTEAVAECVERLPQHTAKQLLQALPAMEALAKELQAVRGH